MKHTYRFAFMIVLMSSTLFACSSQSLTVQTTTTATPAQSISVNPDWITSIDSAREVVKNSSETTDLYLIDMVGGYKRDEDVTLMTFTFIDEKETVYHIGMIDTQNSTTFDIDQNIVLNLNHIGLRKELVSLAVISPIDILNSLLLSEVLSEECFNSVITVGMNVPEESSKYPSVPYWTLIIPKCNNEFITIDVNAQNGDVLDDSRRRLK